MKSTCYVFDVEHVEHRTIASCSIMTPPLLRTHWFSYVHQKKDSYLKYFWGRLKGWVGMGGVYSSWVHRVALLKRLNFDGFNIGISS